MNTTLLCPPSIDNSFGPYAGVCRGGFDFTLLFEETILTIPLSAIFFLIFPLRALQLYRNDKKVVRSPLQICKLVCILSFELAPSDAWMLIALHGLRHALLVFRYFSLRFLFYGLVLPRFQSTEPEPLFRLLRSHLLFLWGLACSLMVNMYTLFVHHSFLISTSSCRSFSTLHEPGHYG